MGMAAAGLLAAVSFVAVAAGSARAGAWLQAPAGYYAKFSVSYLYSETEFDHTGARVPILTSNPLVRAAAYREIDLSTYVEYGVSPRATIVGSLPYKILTSRRTEITELADLIREIDVTNAGFSDLHLGVRTPLVRGHTPVSMEFVGKIPLGYDRSPPNGGPALGSGYADFIGAIMVGTTVRSAYVSASASYRVRGGPLADDAGFFAQAGGTRGRVSGQALLEGWYSTVPPAPLQVSSTTEPANQDVLKVIASLGVRTGAHAVVAAEIYHVIAGKNTVAGTTAAISLVLTR
jgi:hypothetical protein